SISMFSLLPCRRLIRFVFCSFALTLTLLAQTAPKAEYIPFRDAQPILNQLDEILPAELKGKTPEQQAAIWPNWIASRDKEIRTRLDQGDEDSLINFVLFGASFTKQPRVTFEQLNQM